MGKTLAFITVAVVLLLAQPAAALESDRELLALAAMPLAVAAVADIAEVPPGDLIDVVTLLNDAAVPPVQFVEVVRHVPVALAVHQDGRFVELVRQQTQSGVRGTELVTFIEERLYTYGLPATVDLNVTAPRVIELEEDRIVPAVVHTRVAEGRTHPHGGPPGQLKKAAGVQTGAEIVHGGKQKDQKFAQGKGKNRGKGKGKG